MNNKQEIKDMGTVDPIVDLLRRVEMLSVEMTQTRDMVFTYLQEKFKVQYGIDKQKSRSIDIDTLLEMLRKVLSEDNVSEVCIEPFSCCIHNSVGDDSKHVEDFDWILEGFKLRFEAHENS